MTIFSDFPPIVSAGTTLQVRREFQTHPASAGWIYKLAIRAPGYTVREAVVDGDGFVFTLSAADTSAIQAGTYKYSERVERDGVVHEIGTGSITFTENLDSAGDGRSHAQKVLAALEAHIEGRALDGINNYSIAGRVVSKMSIAEAVALRDKYRVKVLMERRGLNWGSAVFTFGAQK